MSHLQRYVVLPAFGFSSPILAQAKSLNKVGPMTALSTRHRARGRANKTANSLRVLHSTHENGPKLVEMTPEAELNLRLDTPGLKIVPVVEYQKLRQQYRVKTKASVKGAAVSAAVTLTIISRADGTPVPGAQVVAFTDFDQREGVEGKSNRQGAVGLKLKPGTVVERLYVYGPAGFWGHYITNVKLKAAQSVDLAPIDPRSTTTLLPGFLKRIPVDAGTGVRVAVIDSGVATAHPALPGVQGANLVFDETRNNPGATAEFGPARVDGEHGTHVAGIVGAKPVGNALIRGVAPGVELRSYRVFPNSGGGATNYDIMNAIDRAVADGCHIINLSLGGGDEDEAVRAAIGKALDNGVLVVAAAGNDDRAAVTFPAALPACVSVSAMGRRGTFEKGSTEESDAAKPFGDPDKDAFIAAFSNVGPQIDVTGPGVGIVSTVPDKDYGTMSGTSMACPAISGMAAFLLGANPSIIKAAKSERAKLLKDALYDSCRVMGFGRDFEGFGLPTA